MSVEVIPFNRIGSIKDIEPFADRVHLAKPYPGRNYDLLVVNVNSTFQQGLIPDGEELPWGLLRVVSAARDLHSLKAGILDSHRLRLMPKDLMQQFQIIEPKVVGLNPTSVNISEAQIIANICEQLKIPYVLGGVHATLNPTAAITDFPGVSAVVRGNAEGVIGDLIKGLLQEEKVPLQGVYYQKENYDNRSDFAPKLNPDQIPIVDQTKLAEAPIYEHTVRINGIPVPIREATLYLSQGCPFDCTFCASPVMNQRGINEVKPYTRPSNERIISEIESSVKDLGANAIHVLDDMAFATPQHIRDLHTGLKDKNLLGKLIWRGSTRVPVIEKLDEETMRILKETGAWKIALGIESGNDTVLNKINKRITKSQIIDAVSRLVSHEIQVKGFFIMGFPGETEEQMRDTQNLVHSLKDTGLNELAIFQFKPYPGTVEYDLIKRTMPDVLPRLSYLRHTDTGLSGKAKFRVEQHDTWLPDDVCISEIPSGKVREYVMQTTEEFYNNFAAN